MNRKRRKIKLIAPALQLRIVAAFAGISILSFILLGLFIASRLEESSRAQAMGITVGQSVWVEMAVLSLGLFLPLTIAVGIILTHRIAGPVYRMEQHLHAVLRGEQPGTCTLREKDELKGLCDLMNRALEYQQQQSAGDGEQQAEDKRKEFRAVS